MPSKQINDLPSDVQQLPEGAQHIFIAAFNSAQEDGMDEQDSQNIAWTSVKREYEQGQDGSWQHKPEENNIHDKAIPSGGN